MNVNQNEVITLLKDSGAMLEGHFLLSSGRHSDRYFQCARLLRYPDFSAAALKEVAGRIRADMDAGKLKIDAVAGPAMGGVIVAYELARQLGLPAIFTERNEAGQMSLKRFEIAAGTNILIAEDVVTTAKSSGEAAGALEEKGAVIAALACVVDRRAPGVDVSWPFYPAVRIEASSWDAADCELCKQGIPVTKPGSRKM